MVPDKDVIKKMKPSSKKNIYADVLIVLGSSIFTKGVPKVMAERVRKAVSLFKTGDYSILILSGGRVRMPVSQAELMHVLAAHNFPSHIAPKNIILEQNSKDTVQKAVFCWEIIKEHFKNREVKSITVVTSNFHLRRAKYIFKSVFSHTKIPLKFVGVPHFLPLFTEVRIKIREIFLYLRLLIKGIR